MFCKNCGAKLPEDARFCSGCGTPIGEPKAQEDAEPNDAQRQDIPAPRGEGKQILETLKKVPLGWAFKLLAIVLGAIGIICLLCLPLIGISPLLSMTGNAVGGMFGMSDIVDSAMQWAQQMATVPGLAGAIGYYDAAVGFGVVMLFIVPAVLAGLGIFFLFRPKPRLKVLVCFFAATIYLVVLACLMGYVYQSMIPPGSTSDLFSAMGMGQGLFTVGPAIVAPIVLYAIVSTAAMLTYKFKFAIPAGILPGAPAQDAAEKTEPENEPLKNTPQESFWCRAAGKLKGISRKKWIIIGVAVAGAVVALCVIGYFASFVTVDAPKLYTLTYSGLNGEGTANLEENAYAEEEIIACFGKAGQGLFAAKDPAAAAAENALATVTYRVEPEEDLSNGDTVTVTAVYDRELFNKAKLSMKNEVQTFTVQTLVDAEEIDVFDTVTVQYEGISPMLTIAGIDKGGAKGFVEDCVYFEPQNDKEYLANGDTVTVEAEYDDVAQEEYAVKVKSDSREYTVGGMPEYLSELDHTALAQASGDFTDKLNATLAGSSYSVAGTYFGGRYASTEKTEEQEDYLLITKERKTSYGTYNRYIKLFECTVNTQNWFGTEGTQETLYVAVLADNLYLDEGELYYDEQLYVSSDKSKEELIRALITSNQDQYTVITDGEAGDIASTPAITNVTADGVPFDENGFVIADSDTRIITSEDLAALKPDGGDAALKDILAFARNEIYARHGNQFDNAVYKNHYVQYDWYSGMIWHKVTDSELSEIEKQNVEVILEAERTL